MFLKLRDRWGHLQLINMAHVREVVSIPAGKNPAIEPAYSRLIFANSNHEEVDAFVEVLQSMLDIERALGKNCRTAVAR